MKKWSSLVLSTLLLALFVSCSPKADKALMEKVPESADILLFLDGKIITQHPLFTENEKDISELLSEASLDKGILESRLLIFGSMKEEWVGFLLQSTNGQVGKFFDTCLKEIKKEDVPVKEFSEKKERRITIKLDENIELLSVLYNENLMLCAINQSDSAFFKAKKTNPLFKKIQLNKVFLSAAVKVDFPKNGKYITKEDLDMAFKQMPFLEKLETLSLTLPFSKDKKQTGDLLVAFKDADGAKAAQELINQGLSEMAKEEPDLANMVTCNVKDNALTISIQLEDLTKSLTAAVEKGREKSLAISCVSNLKMIGLGLAMYTDDNNSKLPAANGWEKDLMPYIGDEKALKCPKDKHQYRYFGNGQKLNTIKTPSTTIVAICECDHQGKRNAVFADGHVESVDPKQLETAVKRAQLLKTLPELK